MKKIVFVLLPLLFLTVSCNPRANSDKIKVGIILPLTGDIAFMGNMFRNAMMMDVDTNYVELLFEDSKGEVKTAINAANKLITSDIDVMVSFLPPVCEAINPICKKKNITHFVFTFSPNIADESNVIKQFPSSDAESHQFIKYIKDLGFSNVCFFRHMYPDADVAYHTIIEPILDSLSVNVTDIPHMQSEKDYRNLALKALSEQPDIVVVQSLSINYDNIIRVFEQNQYNNLLFDLNCVDFCTNETKVAQMEGCRFVGMDFITTERFEDFCQEYKMKFSSEPYVFGVFPKDLMLVLNNLHIIGTSKSDIINYCSNNNLSGIAGPIKYDLLGNLVIDYSILRFEDGKIKFN